MGIENRDFTGALYKTSKVDVRRLFIASMVHLYYPQVYFQDEISFSKNGFVRSIAKVLGEHDSNTSLRIREVILWEKEYDDFKEKVGQVLDKLREVA